MTAKEVNSNYPYLCYCIHKSIITSANRIVNKCVRQKNKAQEPDFIASLTLYFSPKLFIILKRLFPKKKFSVTGVYCHQKPTVDIGIGISPELGDILFLYIHKDSNNNIRYNSLLLQAKISATSTVKVSPNDQHQLELYTSWPKFTYKRAGILNGVTRDIIPKTINDGAQYLLIDDDPANGLSGLVGTYPMGCAIPDKELNINNDLATELVEFLKFKSGRAFQEKGTINDDWSRMIWDILDIVKSKASKRKNAGLNNFPRVKTNESDGCFSFKTDGLTTSEFNELRPNSEDIKIPIEPKYFEDSDNPSLSVILIECTEEN